ncbi:aldehyde dehydrogenase family protein [Mycolicibacterium wolinskyi]|uniref:aldehyde dehydrogenase family protein n=1 Tax=Mycolicibacterium wolinskyi TaxID=59750 RepID=UPI003917726E
MTSVMSIDPRTGRATGAVAEETSPDEVAACGAAAERAAPGLDAMGRKGRAQLLESIATALDGARQDVVTIADSETAIGSDRLGMELTRTVLQLRMFADVISEGGYLEAAVDHAADTPIGPAPDIRRMLVPLGPVAVFGSSNFPLAFSVPGGDTASALAAGNPVIVKAHGSHPATSQRVFDIMAEAARAAGAPAGSLGIVHGQAAGATLVGRPEIQAVGFTGSLDGARALMDVIGRRPDPIPFYGELSSINPVIVTAAAVNARGPEIGAAAAASFTTSAGQLCTKPGLIFVPRGSAGDELVAALCAAAENAPAATLLNSRIHDSFVDYLDSTEDPFTVLVRGLAAQAGYAVSPAVLGIDAAVIRDGLIEECFGPLTVVARYDTEAEVIAAIRTLPSSLTLTVHHEPGDVAQLKETLRELRDCSGRIVLNGFPTGVRVSWAQHHGGRWPATNTLHTSVGATAIRRFLRPMVWQNAPAELLPAELHDGDPVVPIRIDGRLHLPR